jgi:ubiquitin carboxyl-terminal hydrolase 48
MGAEESSSQFRQSLGPDFPKTVQFYKFHNYGNSCYINAVLQSLLALPSVTSLIQSLQSLVSRQFPKNISQSVLFVFLRSFSRIKSSDGDGAVTPSLADFLDSIFANSDEFVKGIQCDAHELWIFLINSFDDTLKLIAKDFPDLPNFGTFESIFQGFKVSWYECSKCSDRSERRESFTSLTIPILPDSDLQSLIDESLVPEPLDSDWKCDKCGNQEDTVSATHFAKLPPVLCVQLLRFRYDRHTQAFEKVDDFVSISQELLLNSASGLQRYHLSSIIVHHGRSLQEGHFMQLRPVHGRWILANDNALSVYSKRDVESLLTVSPTKRDQIVPFMLFYVQP